MKNGFLILYLGICLALFPLLEPSNFGESKTAETNNGRKQEIRIMSYNIHHANPPSKEGIIDLKAIISTIKAEDPDLVALQEIDANTQRSGDGNQAQLIGDSLGMHVFFAKAIDFEGGDYGVAILSKFPILVHKIVRLPTDSKTNGEPRVLATVKVKLPDGRTIRFGSTHLDAQKADINRLLQIEKITETARTEKLPFIIAGDFNSVEGGKVIGTLDGELKRTCTECAPTIPAGNPTKAIDFIFFGSAGNILVNDHRVIKEVYASDHLPVLAVLSL